MQLVRYADGSGWSLGVVVSDGGVVMSIAAGLRRLRQRGRVSPPAKAGWDNAARVLVSHAERRSCNSRSRRYARERVRRLAGQATRG